jgi:hypothetical protein
MKPVHPSYLCHCQIPTPQRHLAEETGLCEGCHGIFDQRLYEMRLRQHVSSFTYDSLDEFLRAVDPNYRRLVSAE